MNIKKLVFVLGMTGFPAFLYSQSGLAIGYNVGMFRFAQHNLQAYSQMYNHAAGPDLKVPMKMTGFYRGIVVGWKQGNETFMAGIRWSTKKAVSSAGENADGTERIRLRMNTINSEFAIGGENVKAGISIDVGGVKVHKKTYDKKTGVTSNWEPFYLGGGLLRSGTIAIGSTFFLDVQLGNFLELRPFIQFSLSDTQISDDRTRRDYAFPLRNIGFSLCLILPSDD